MSRSIDDVGMPVAHSPQAAAPLANIPLLAQMRLGLDARHISSPRDGISRHLRRVVEECAALESWTPLTGFIAPSDQATLDQVLSPAARCVFNPVVADVPLASSRAQPVFSRLLRRHPVDLFHSHHLFVPLLASVPSVLTVHDIIPLKFPELYPAEANYLKRIVPRSLHRARHIMTDAEFTKRDLMQSFGVPEAKISVVPLGVEEHFQPCQDRLRLEEFRRRHHLPERFVLWIGSTRPTKNLPLLIEALAHLKHRAHLPHRLVLTRGPVLQDGRIIDSMARHRVLRDIVFLDAVPEAEMPLLYNAAELFVFPSLYEGFGLPPLEAMACGTPVVCSNAATLPEVVGDAAIQINPHDALELAAAMWMVLDDQSLRDEMRQRGLQQAQKFTWRETARRTLEVYARVLS